MEIAENDSQREQYKSIRDAVWYCYEIEGLTKLVALRLVEHWPNIFPSLRFLAKICGCSIRTVRNAIRELEKKQVIYTFRRKATSSGYGFVGVSIPSLGVRQTVPTPPEGDPRHDVPTPPAPFADPPRHEVPPKQEVLSSKFKQGRGSARGARRPKNPPSPVLASPNAPDAPLYTSFLGWEMPSEFRADCISRGINAARFDFRFAILRNSPLKKPVFDLRVVVLEALEWWLAWEQPQKADPDSRAATAPQIDFPSDLVNRAGGWVPKPAELEYAKLKAIDPAKAYAAYVKAGKAENKSEADNDRDFRKALEMLVRKRKQSPVQHAVAA